MQTEHLKATGMSCGGCTSKVTNALTGLAGVNDVKVSLAAGGATVQYDERVISPDNLESVVKDAGYGVEPVGAAPGQHPKGSGCA